MSVRLRPIVDAKPVAPGVVDELAAASRLSGASGLSGVCPNVASFVGPENLRAIHASADRRTLTDEELSAACALLDSELADGALGLGSAVGLAKSPPVVHRTDNRRQGPCHRPYAGALEP